MHDNRNASAPFSCSNGNGVVCIDTRRVLDSCRDKDCYEDAKVYLNESAEALIATATAVRTKSAKLLWAYVGISEVPFNCGFYQVTVRYYIEVEVEVCTGIGKSQLINGLSILDKDVILYGGEGTVTTFTSGPDNDFCYMGGGTAATNAPVAVVDTVEPVVLSTRIKQECHCCNCLCDVAELPDAVAGCINGNLVTTSNGPQLVVSLGIFSVIRIERPTQILVQATDYSVPDKECTPAGNNDSPCDLFRTIAFPTARFQGNTCCENTPPEPHKGGGCGCGRNG